MVALLVLALCIGTILLANAGAASSAASQNSTSSAPTEQPTATVGTSAPTAPPVHYPPTTRDDLHGLAAQGTVSAIHEFHSESTGLTGACPQPEREADNGYTAGRIVVDVTGANGAGNVDPNATNLKYTLTLDVGGFDSNKEYVVTY